MLVMLTAVLPVLVTVTVCGLLLVPTFCGGKVSCAGEMPMTVPMPFSSITCGLEDALSWRETKPVAAPATVGWKLTVRSQLAAWATLPPQEVLNWNGPVTRLGCNP